MKRYENLEEVMCKELEKLDRKYATGEQDEMTVQDAEKVDLLYHALKSAATYYAMKEAEGGRSYRDGMDGSYAMRRDARGRYVSRDMDGYSGHYPDWMPPMYPRY